MNGNPGAVRAVLLDKDGTLVDRRVVPIQLLRDRAPTVRLAEPARDLVLATPSGAIAVHASAEDDFGVHALELHWVRSRGSGESFDFEEGVWTWDDEGDEPNGRTASRVLRLEELGLAIAAARTAGSESSAACQRADAAAAVRRRLARSMSTIRIFPSAAERRDTT